MSLAASQLDLLLWLALGRADITGKLRERLAKINVGRPARALECCDATPSRARKTGLGSAREACFCSDINKTIAGKPTCVCQFVSILLL